MMLFNNIFIIIGLTISIINKLSIINNKENSKVNVRKKIASHTHYIDILGKIFLYSCIFLSEYRYRGKMQIAFPKSCCSKNDSISSAEYGMTRHARDIDARYFTFHDVMHNVYMYIHYAVHSKSWAQLRKGMLIPRGKKVLTGAAGQKNITK